MKINNIRGCAVQVVGIERSVMGAHLAHACVDLHQMGEPATLPCSVPTMAHAKRVSATGPSVALVK